MNFIKKIIDKNLDESVHLQFQKFSRGEFRNKAVIQAKFSAGKYSINTSAEFGNELVRDVAEKLGDKKTKVTGGIITTSNLEGELNFKTKKQFQGVKNYGIDDEMTGKEIVNLLNKLPKAFFGLSFSTEDTVLKIKAKAPKSGKPSSKGEAAPKPDFCKLVTTDKKLGSTFIFEKDLFKKAEFNHTFFIDNIVIPEELKKEKDFAIVREKSLRVGRIIRKGLIDEKEVSSEIKFEA
jgi:hypothetical protein